MRIGRRRDKGQSLAEFALVLLPLMLILLGIVQLGLILNAYVTVANAAREGARTGSIWIANPTDTQQTNDTNRETSIDDVVNGSLGLLTPGDATTSVTYSDPTDATDIALGCRGTAGDVRRKDQCVRVKVTYHLTLIIPLIADLLPKDSNGQMSIPAQSQMVIN